MAQPAQAVSVRDEEHSGVLSGSGDTVAPWFPLSRQSSVC
ncbi:hypothetical protein FM103_14620 [Corynebacterium xerosis]|nr:hypothetical protein FM103_14620 [Corynebacterium xerosis]